MQQQEAGFLVFYNTRSGEKKKKIEVHRPDLKNVDKFTHMALETFECKLKEEKIVFNSDLITFEGIDGTGKTTLALQLANQLKNEKHDKPIVVLRGSGTTGVQELIDWTKEQENMQDKEELINDLEQILKFQQEYTASSGGKKLDKEKAWQIGVNMHIFMFQTINKYLNRGYTVISDRGIVSFMLTLAERTQKNEGDFKQILEHVLEQCGAITVGRQILVDSPLQAAVENVISKENKVGEEELKKAAQEGYVRSYDFLKFYNQFRPKHKDWFFYVENLQDYSLDTVLRDIVDNIKTLEKMAKKASHKF